MKQFKTRKLCKATARLGAVLCRRLKNLFKCRSRPQAPPLDQLSDVALLSIFSHFPVGELLQRKALNVRLEELQVEACGARRKLDLLVGPDAGDIYARNFPADPISTLALGGLTLSAADRLVGQLPRLRRLLLVLPRIQKAEMSALLRLLRGWSGSLRKLDIHIRTSKRDDADPAETAQLRRLLVCLNGLSQLKQLRFRLDGYLFPRNTVDQSLYLPVLSHLEAFTFCSPDWADCLVDSCVHYLRENTKLVRLTIANLFTRAAVQRFMQMEPSIAPTFTLFAFHRMWRPTYEQFGNLVHHFAGIREMIITLPGTDYTLPAVVRLLRSLSGLRVVSLALYSFQFEMDAIQGYLQQAGPEQEPLLDALPGVTYLRLAFYDIHSHEDIDALQIEAFFPSIKELNIESFTEECAICGTFGARQGRQDHPQNEARAEACCEATMDQMIPRFPMLENVRASL